MEGLAVPPPMKMIAIWRSSAELVTIFASQTVVRNSFPEKMVNSLVLGSQQ